MARENSGWGYDRIVGALANLRSSRVADPVPRTGAKTRGPIAWVRELALVQRQTPATDASRQPRSKALKLGDAFVNAAGPTV
jgi:hypothetical protein